MTNLLRVQFMTLSLIKLFWMKKLLVILSMNSQLLDVLKIFTRYTCVSFHILYLKLTL